MVTLPETLHRFLELSPKKKGEKTMNKKLITGTLVLSLLASAPSFAMPFTDTHDQSVEYAYQNNLMKGISPTIFSPYDHLTRGQFATVLANLTKEVPNGTLPFTDVKKGAYYYNSVLWAYNNKIITGTTEKTFSPNATLNREQVASMVSAYWKKYLSMIDLEQTHTKFSDEAEISPWAKESVAFAGQIFKDAGIMVGSYFGPKRPLTRLETAKLISHLDKLKRPIPIDRGTQHYSKANDEPPMNDYIRMNNALVDSWWTMINTIKNESTTPTEEQKAFLEMINSTRRRLLLPPLQLMSELKPIADIRANEAHAWYARYALNKEKAPESQKTPYIRPTTGTEFQKDLNHNNAIFKNTKFYQLIDKKEKIKILQSTFEKSFTEYLLYVSDQTTAQDIAKILLTSSNGRLANFDQYTHVYFVKHAENGQATWEVLLFNENAGKGILKKFLLNS